MTQTRWHGSPLHGHNSVYIWGEGDHQFLTRCAEPSGCRSINSGPSVSCCESHERGTKNGSSTSLADRLWCAYRPLEASKRQRCGDHVETMWRPRGAPVNAARPSPCRPSPCTRGIRDWRTRSLGSHRQNRKIARAVKLVCGVRACQPGRYYLRRRAVYT
jgi:hypothetical protein